MPKIKSAFMLLGGASNEHTPVAKEPEMRSRKISNLNIAAAALLTALFSWALPTSALSAQGGPEDVAPAVTLEGLMAEAVEKNPELRAKRMAWEAAKEKRAQAVSLQDPRFTYTESIRDIETRLGPQERSFGLSQKLPFPGKLGLRGEIADKEAEMARIEYEKALTELRAEVKKAFFELYFIDRALELDLENKAVLEYFYEVSRTNYGLDVSELDELVRAQKSSAGASLDLLRAENTREAVTARINTLLDRAPGAPVGKAAEFDPPDMEISPEELYRMAEAYNEEIRISGLAVEKTDLERRLSEYTWRPDFTIGLNYSQIGELDSGDPEAGRDALSVTFGVNVPLWFGRNRAVVDEKTKTFQERLLERGSVVTRVKNRVRREYFDLVTAGNVMELYGERLIPEAKESVDFAEARYKTGREMLGRMLEAQSMWINFRLVYHRAVTDYMKAVAELERLTGSELTQAEGEDAEDE